MNPDIHWQYDEFQQIGKDYTDSSEVNVYDSSHSDFRDIEAEALQVFERLGLTPTDRLLDIGCGTGTFAILAAQRCKSVVAADVSQEMLNYAKKKAFSENVSNIDFVHSGFLNYEPNGDPPTIISSTFAFHHLPDFWKGIALKRMHNVLADNGQLYLCDVILDEENPIEKISKFIEKQSKIGGDFLRDDAIGHFKEEFSTYEWVIDGSLERSGFKIESKERHDGIVVSYVCTKKR